MSFKSLSAALVGVVSVISFQNVFGATAVEDTYNINGSTVISDPFGECGIGHLLTPHPLSNDIVVESGDLSVFSNTIVNTNILSNGVIFNYDLDGDQSPETPIFYPFCGSNNNGSFATQEIFTYDLFDTGDGSRDQGTIIINPPAPPSASDDDFDADSLPASVGPGTGEVTYSLGGSPFANDVLNSPVDINVTVRATDNFNLVSGPGYFQNFIDADGNPALNFIANQPFTTPAIIDYTLRDARGNVIDGTDATITIRPPTPPNAVDDNLNIENLNLFISGVSGLTGYSFDPIANDTTTIAVDSNFTLQQNNFTPVGNPNGNLIVEQTAVVSIYFVPGPNFTTDAQYTYDLLDGNGNVLDTATITISPPSQRVAPVADVYDALTLNQVTDGNGNIGYSLEPNPLTNDPTILVSNSETAFATDNFQLQSGIGTLNILPNEGPIIFEYYPGPSFTQPAVFTYNLRDYNGNVQSGSTTVTINPPPAPTTSDDVYDANNLAFQPGPSAGQTTYTLSPDPFSNDSLVGIYNEAMTINATDNFVVSSGQGILQINSDQNGLLFELIADVSFASPIVIDYNLRDGNGNIIAGTDATITVNPPAQTIAVDDTESISNLTLFEGGQVAVGYSIDPLSNDTLGAIIDLDASLQQSNFNPVGSPNGALYVEPTSPGAANIYFVPGANFTTQAQYTYNLLDGNGSVLDTATITIAPPSPAVNPVDDNYNAIDLTVVTDANGNTAYVLSPTPFANDTFTNLISSSRTILATDNFNQINGIGNIQRTESGNSVIFEYYPGPNFDEPAILNYNLRDFNGNIQSSTATITINPPSQPTTTDDVYNAANLAFQPGPGTGQTTYTLVPNPLSNDSLIGLYDEAATISATDNFTSSSSLGNLQVSSGQNGLVFEFVGEFGFNSPVVVNYNLRDAQGNVITGTDATITINPPVQTDAVDFAESIENLSQYDGGANGIGYILDPLSNDVLGTLVDLDASLQQNNFTPLGSPNGSLIVEPLGQGAANIYFVPGANFDSAAQYSYNLVDGSGFILDSATLTIDPPTSPVAPVDDVYNAGNLTQVTDPNGNIGYSIAPSPFGNDPASNLWSEFDSVTAPNNFQLVSGSGVLNTFVPDGPIIYEFYPGPNFDQPTQFTYNLYDRNGNVQSSAATITINPPNLATTTDDVYDANQLNYIAGPGAGQISYALTPDPLSNDNLVGLYDEAETVNANDNFVVVSGQGDVQITSDQNGLVFDFITDHAFSNPITINYNLRDGQGNAITNTEATITINPPTAITTVDDVLEADNSNQVETIADTSSGFPIYRLLVSPFLNDTLAPPYDEIGTIDAQNNFAPVAGTVGQLIIEDQAQFQLRYIPGQDFIEPAVFNYFLADGAGNAISGTEATITINPPSPQGAPATENDSYEADDLTVITTAEVGDGYILQPTPFSNDTLDPPYDEQQSVTDPNNFSLQSGTGNLFVNSGQNGLEFTYYPETDFTETAVFNYYLLDNAGNSIPGTDATITINPPSDSAVVAATDDELDIENDLTITQDEVTGELTYTLNISPFDNDTVDASVDINQTISAQDNFTVTSGEGTFQAVLENGTSVFRYFSSAEITSTVVIAYNLRDAQGNVIPNTDAVITFSPSVSLVANANDDAYQADDLVQNIVDGETEYVLSPTPLANDSFVTLDAEQTLVDSNFVLDAGVGSISVSFDSNDEPVFTYTPGGAFTSPAVFTYTLYDSSPDIVLAEKLGSENQASRKPSQDTATITINPPSQIPGEGQQLSKTDDVNVACTLQSSDNLFCSSLGEDQRLLMLSTITAQADSLFGLQGDQINNIRQRLIENRSAYNPASVSGLNSVVYGKNVPIGQMAQSIINQNQSGGGAADDNFNSGRFGFFINGRFITGERQDSDFAVGFDSDGFNLTSGIDYRVNQNFILGGAIGIAEEEVDFSSDFGDQTVELTSFTFYGNYYSPATSFYVDAMAMLSNGDLDIKRNLTFGGLDEVARGNTEGQALSFAGTSGFNWNARAWELDLYGRVEYTNLQIDGYSETGSSFDLTVEDQDVDSLEAAFGSRIARVFSTGSGVIIPSIDLEILKQFEGDTRFIGVDMEQFSTGFGVKDEAEDSNYFNAGFSLSTVFANGFSAYFRADSSVANDQLRRTSYGAGLRWEF